LTYVTLLGLNQAEEMAKEEAEKCQKILISMADKDTSLLQELVNYNLTRTT